MATSLWSTPLDNTSNAGFQAWATELIVKLLAVNTGQLTQTADTGQLANPVVAARPSANTSAGYWILKWNDGTSTPLYFRVDVGTGANTSIPRIQWQIGSGTDGAGNLTGAVSAQTIITVNVAAASAVTNYTSYLCCATGGFGLLWKGTANSPSNTGEAFVLVARSIDDSGVVNNDGYLTVSPTSSPTSWSAQSVNLSNNVVFSSSASTMASMAYNIIPLGITSSVVGGNAQYFRCFAAYPLARPIGHMVAVIAAEFTMGTSFNGESGSITDHTFLSLGRGGQQGTYCLAMLWQ